MKKSKFLATTLMLTLLSGSFVVSCGGTTSSIAEEFADRILVAEPKEDVMVGDTINLDDYVEVQGIKDENNFTATLKTEDTATLDGHLLKVTAEGEIKVEIVAGANNKKANFQTESLSTFRAAFKAKTQFTTDYFVEELEVDQQYNVYSTGTGIVHNSKYFAMPDWFTYDEDGNPVKDANDNYVYKEEPSYNGYVKIANGKTYEFVMDNLNGKNAEVLPGPQTDLQYYYLAMGNSLSYTDFKTEYYNGEPIGLSTTDPVAIQNFCRQSCGIYDPATYGKTVYNQTWTGEMFVEFYGESLETAQIAIMVLGYTPTDQAVLFTYCLIDSENPEMYTIEFLENYIKEKKEPVALKSDELLSKVNEISAAKNYTLTTEYFVSESGAVNAENPGYTGTMTLPEETITQLVTEDTVVTSLPASEGGEIKSIYHVKDGKVYYGDNYTYDKGNTVVTDANNVPIASNVYRTEEVENCTSIWDDEDLSLITIKSAADSTLYQNVEVSINRETSSGRYIAFVNRANSTINIARAFMISAAGYGYSLDQYYIEDDGQGTMYDYLDLQVLITDDELVVDMAVGFATQSGGVLYYHVRSTYSNVGTTVAPDVSSIF